MKYKKEELIEYRFSRAVETLEEADILSQSYHWNTVANRLYYSAFYAVLALFAMNEIGSESHSGAKTLFHREYIKTGIISIRYGKLYSDLFNKRQEGDYEDFLKFTEHEIQPLISDVADFIAEVKTILSA